MLDVEVIEGERNGSRFDKFLSNIQFDLGLEHASFTVLKPTSSKAVVHSTYPAEWLQHYMENGYQHVDPAVTIASRAIAPVDWDSLKNLDGYGEVFSAASDFNIPSNGLSIPVRGFLGEVGLLIVSATLPDREWELLRTDKLVALQQQAAFLVDRIGGLATPLAEHLRPQLSRLEKDALQWAGIGLDDEEIGGRMGISDAMVRICLRSARTKLRVLTTPQAVGRAIMQNIISPV